MGQDENKNASELDGVRPVFKSAGQGNNPTITYMINGKPVQRPVVPTTPPPKPVTPPAPKPVEPPKPAPTKTVETVTFKSVGQGNNPLVTHSINQVPLSKPAANPVKPALPKREVRPARKISAKEELDRIAIKPAPAPTPKKKPVDKKKLIIIGALVGVLVVVCIVCGIIAANSGKKNGKATTIMVEETYDSKKEELKEKLYFGDNVPSDADYNDENLISDQNDGLYAHAILDVTTDSYKEYYNQAKEDIASLESLAEDDSQKSDAKELSEDFKIFMFSTALYGDDIVQRSYLENGKFDNYFSFFGYPFNYKEEDNDLGYTVEQNVPGYIENKTNLYSRYSNAGCIHDEVIDGECTATLFNDDNSVFDLVMEDQNYKDLFQNSSERLLSRMAKLLGVTEEEGDENG